MAENTNEKMLAKDTVVMEPVIDKHYQLIETKRAEEIIEKAMNLARERIPNGKVATGTGKNGSSSARYMPLPAQG